MVNVPSAYPDRSSATICGRSAGASGRLVTFSSADHLEEAIEAVHDHHPGAGPHPAAQDRVQTEDVEQRQRGQQHRVGVDKAEPVDLVQVSEQRPMAEHRRLGNAGGSGGGEQHGERLRVLRRVHRVVGPRGRERAYALAGQREMPHPGDLRILRSDQHVGTGELEHLGQPGGGEIRIERHDDDPGAQGAEIGQHELDAVRPAQAQALTGHHLAGEPGRDRGDVVIELRPGQRAPLRTRLDQRRTVRGASGVAGDQISEIAGRGTGFGPRNFRLVFGHPSKSGTSIVGP